MKRLPLNSLFFICAISLISQASLSEILFNNGSYSGYQDNTRNIANEQSLYDNFNLTDHSIITGFKWSQHDHININYVATEISIFDGIPISDNLIYKSNFVATRTSNSTGPIFNDWLGYDYLLDDLNINLLAGTYFLGLNTIRTNGWWDSSWDQTTGNSSTIPGRYLINSNYPEPGNFVYEDHVFEIIGVPEPSMLILFGLGGLFLRRKR